MNLKGNYHFLDKPIPTQHVSVAQALATQHLASRSKLPKGSPICSIGMYIMLFGDDCLYIPKRPKNALLYPSRYDGTGVALNVGTQGNYVEDVANRIQTKFDVKFSSDVTPYAFLFDNACNIAIIAGYATAEASSIDNEAFTKVGFTGFRDFFREHTLAEWNHPAFHAALLAIQAREGLGASSIMWGERKRFSKKPTSTKSTIECLGV
jgi:hypothetical protein